MRSQYLAEDTAVSVDIPNVCHDIYSHQVGRVHSGCSKRFLFTFPSLAQLSKEEYVTLLFFYQESIFKAFYHNVGYIFGFDAVSMIAASSLKLTFKVRKPLSNRWPLGKNVDVHYCFYITSVFTFGLLSSFSFRYHPTGCSPLRFL